MRGRPSRSTFSVVLLLVLLFASASCSRRAAPPAAETETSAPPAPPAIASPTPSPLPGPTAAGAPGVELLPVPEPDLSAAESGVRTQVAERERALRERLADAHASRRELAKAYGDLGLVFVTYEFPDAATACFENGRRLDADSFQWVYLLGYVKNHQARYDEAATLFGRTLELKPDYLPARLRLAGARLALGQRDEAAKLYREALSADPSCAPALEGLGKVAVAAGEDRAAVGFFERALALAPSASSLRYALGQAYRRLGDLKRAKANLAKAGETPILIDDPLIDPVARLGKGAQFYAIQGKMLLDQGHFGSAAESFRKSLGYDPKSFEVRLALSYSLEKLGDLPGAEQQLSEALHTATTGDPGKDRAQRAEVLQVRGGLEVLAGKDREAIADFRSSLAIDPDQAGVRLKLANALARNGELEAAVGEYGRLIEESPEHAPALLVKRGTALVNLGRRDAALADFARAARLAPEDPGVHRAYADALEFVGDAAGAARERAAVERLARRSGDRSLAATAEAQRLVERGDYETAIKRYREALASDPESFPARYGLASVLGHVGRYDEAVGEFSRLLDKEPRHAPARQGLVVALILGGRYGEARVALRDAVRLFPRDARLALVQARLLAAAPDPRVRDGRLALEIARRVFADRKDPVTQETMAMALAAAGELPRAVELQQALVDRLAGGGGRLGDFRRELAAYEAGRPFLAGSPDDLLAPVREIGGPG